MRRIKVLQVIRLAEGGMKEHFLSLLRNLDQNKFSLVAAGPFTDSLAEELRNWGVGVYQVPIPSNVSPRKDLSCLIQLQRILAREKIDLIHMHGSKAALLGRLAARLSSTKCAVFTVHNFILDNYQSKSKRLLFTFLEQSLVPFTQKIITVSSALKEELSKQQRITAEKMVTIYNGLAIDQFCPAQGDECLKEKLGFSSRNLVVGTVARLIPEKGIQYFLESAVQIKNARKGQPIGFLIVGDGPFRPVLEKQAQRLDLGQQVFFTGYKEEIKELLSIVDIFVLPSLSEGLGIALLEAMAMGKPVIGSQVGGIPEVIQPGVNGYLFPPADFICLTEAILQLVDNPLARFRMGQEGRRIVEEKFSLQKMVESIEDLYCELMGL